MSDKNDDVIPARWGYRAERATCGVLPCLPPNQWVRSVIRHRKINTNTDETILSYTLFGNLTLFFGSQMLEKQDGPGIPSEANLPLGDVPCRKD